MAMVAIRKAFERDFLDEFDLGIWGCENLGMRECENLVM